MSLAGAAFGAEASSGPSRLSDFFPQDTLVYLETPSIPKVIEGAKGTGLYALWQDDAFIPVRRQWEEYQAKEAKNGRADSITFFSAVPGGAAAGYWRMRGRDEFLVVIESGAAEAQARSFVQSFLANPLSGGETATTAISGVEVTTSAAPGLCGAVVDGLTFIGSMDSVAFALDRRKARAAEGSLSASVSFVKAASFFTAPEPAYRMVLDLPAVLSIVKSAAADAPLDVNKLLSVFGIDDIETVSVEASFRGAGVIEHVYVSTASVESTIVALAGGAPLDEARLAVIPRTAVFAGARTVDFTKSYDAVMEMLEALEMSRLNLRAPLRNFEVRSGISIEKDVLPLLGRAQITWYDVPDKIDMAVLAQGGIEQVTLIEVRDEAAVQAVLDKFVLASQSDPAMLAELAQPGGPAPEVATSTSGTLKIYYLTAPGMMTPGPAAAVSGNYLVFANGKDTVKKVVDRLIAPGPAITDSADFARVRGLLSRPAQQVGYVNLDRIVEVLYASVMPLVAPQIDAAHANGQFSFSSAEVPQSYVIKKHVDGAGMAVSASGNLIDLEIYSPTGVVGLAAMVLGEVRGGKVTRNLDVARGLTKLEPTTPERQRLLDIGGELQLSTVERKGRFPDAISEVLPADRLQAPQDAAPDSPVDYVYVPGYTTSSPGRRILVYERDGLSDTGRHVLFVDGTVESLPEDKFQELMNLPKAGSNGGQESGAPGA